MVAVWRPKRGFSKYQTTVRLCFAAVAFVSGNSGILCLFLCKYIYISSAASSFQSLWWMLPWPYVGFPTREPQVSQTSKLAGKFLAAHVRTENESSQCRSWEITNHNLNIPVQGGACSKSCFSLFDFHVARSVQPVLVLEQQLALQVDTIGKHGLQKDHHMRTCIPRMSSSAWRTRRILTGLQVKESQPERDPFGCVRARCRGLMTPMKWKMVRNSQSRSPARPLQCCQKHVLLCVYSCRSQHWSLSAPLCCAKHLCVGRCKNSLDPGLKSRSVKLSCPWNFVGASKMLINCYVFHLESLFLLDEGLSVSSRKLSP